MTIKKFFGLLSLFGLFLLMIVNPVTAEEISGAIYSEDNLIAKASEGVVSVPVYMENDPGLMGYVLQFDYDPNVLTPSEVKQGDILQSGNFNDNIEGDATEGSFKVMWNHAESVAENGLLFDIEFEIAKEAKDSTEIQVTALSSDTYNEEFEPANLNCRNIPIEIEHINKFG